MNRLVPAIAVALLISACGSSKKETPPPPACPAGQTLCGSTCVDLALDKNHCGTCATACVGDEVCAAGVCSLSCGTDRLACGDYCVAYLNDSSNCGDCGIVCGTGTACELGKCEIQCSGLTPDRCGSEAAGFCTNLQTDDTHCGTCGTDCTAIAGDYRCEKGICQIQCASPLVRCGSGQDGACTPVDTTSHCGNCTVACDASETCRYGLCTTSTCRGLLLPGAPLSPAADVPVAEGTGDFDGDSITDLVIADDSPTQGASLLFLKGRGDGTFDPPVVLQALVAPTAIAVADLDVDGNLDLVVASSSAGVSTLQPLYGDGTGHFAARTDSAVVTGASPQAITVADLNFDGAPDLIVGDGAAQAAGNLNVFLGELDGTYVPTGLLGLSGGAGNPRTASQTLTVGLDVRGVATGNLNGDVYYPDLIVASNPTALPAGDARCFNYPAACWLAGEVFYNDTSGGLTRPANNTFTTDVELSPNAMATGDVNDDTLTDWALADAAHNLVVLFVAPWSGLPFSWDLSSVSSPRALLMEDFDGDLYPDLVTVNATAGALYYHHNDGPTGAGGGVKFADPVPLPVGESPTATALAPVAVSGASYLFTTNAGTHDVAATQALGGGLFDAPALYRAGWGTSAIALGDLNGDGRLDLATADVSNNQAKVWLQVQLGQPAGTFQTPATLSLPDDSAPVSMAAASLDGDTNTDLAIALEGTAQVAVLWGDGTGAFPASSFLSTGPDPQQVIAADLNGDGKIDLATADMGANQVTLLLNQGSRAFTRATLAVGAGPRSVAAVKLGASNCLDLVTANATAGTLTILPCDAAHPGQFLAPTTVTACAGARSLAVADFDPVSTPDVAVACDEGIAVYRGPGDGTLVGGAMFDAGGAPRSISAADVDGDGWVDLLASVPFTGGVSVLHGASNLGFSPPRVYPVGGEALATVTANLFGHTDGRNDVCAAVGNPAGAFLGAGAVVMESGCLP